MSKLLFSFFFLILSFYSKSIFAQTVSSMHASFIAELETVQSPTTQTFISCSMKRHGHIITHEEQILIHRSTDLTASWTLIDVMMPPTNGRLIDPVITVDQVGNYYIIFMRIEDGSIPIAQRTTYLDLYRSTDDGISWQFVGSPFTDIFPDYPQLISRGNGELFLTFGNYIAPFYSDIKFMTSTDGGFTWTAPISFSQPIPTAIGLGISDLNWGTDSSIHLGFGSSNFKGPCHIKSTDDGLTWSDFSFVDQNATPALSSVLAKVISNPTVNFEGILSHRPHFSTTPITFHYFDGDQLESTLIGHGAYAEAVLTNDSIIHVVYNALENDTFRLKYAVSDNQGISFTPPIVLYTAPNEIEELGEYQSLILGNDSLFYLTFCDWADSSIAKTIVFEPINIDFNPILNTTELTNSTLLQYAIFPNPSTGTLTLQYPNHSSPSAIVISTLDGKIIKTITSKQMSDNTIQIDLSSLSNGTYLICFIEKSRHVVRKFVKTN